MPLGHWQK